MLIKTVVAKAGKDELLYNVAADLHIRTSTISDWLKEKLIF